MNSEKNQIAVYCAADDCKKPQSLSFTPSEFDEWIEEDAVDCNSCGTEMSVEGVTLECHICGAEIEFDSLSQISLLCDERCPYCAGNPTWDADFLSVVVAGSWAAEYAVYDWTANRQQTSCLERSGRTDYWEGLVHFCTASEFISIYESRCIKAASTGLYCHRNPSQTKAICLTETTQPNWGELQSSHGEYGFVFRKRDIIGLGGAPAIYLPQSVIEEMKAKGETIPPTLWPYLNMLRLPSLSPGTKYDFLHEREWRVPKDISFDVLRPFAVTFPKRRPRIDGEELILRAAREFHELSGAGR
jgi:hypothetical protein